MVSKYADSDIDEDDIDFRKARKKKPEKISSRLERWNTGRQEVYFYEPDGDRIGTRDLVKILTPKEVQFLRQHAKKGITVKRNTPTAKGIHQTKKATPSKLVKQPHKGDVI
jgi:hypothetical protein